MTANTTPLEDAEQIVVVQWLELQGLKFTAIPNSTYTKSWKQKSKNKNTGLRPGFPDLIILIAPHQAIDGRGRLLALEMKRQKGGVVSAEQKAWIAALNGLKTPHIDSVVAHGSQEAIEYIASFIHPTTSSPF